MTPLVCLYPRSQRTEDDNKRYTMAADFDRLALLSRRAIALEAQVAALHSGPDPISASRTWLPDDLVARPQGVEPSIGTRREAVITLLLEALAAERMQRHPPSPLVVLGLSPHSARAAPHLTDEGLQRWHAHLCRLAAAHPTSTLSNESTPADVARTPDRLCTFCSASSPSSVSFTTLCEGYCVRATISVDQRGHYACLTQPEVTLGAGWEAYVSRTEEDASEAFISGVLWPAIRTNLVCVAPMQS